VNAIAGSNVVMLGLDLPEARREGCLGFAIQREDHTEDERYWMSGTKTFAETEPALGPGGQVSSREHPFQTFQWADYSAKPAHDYTYSAIPLYGSPSALEEGPRASVRVQTESEVGETHTVFFNRGSVATQEYARRFQNKAPDKLAGEEREAAFRWLSRGLVEALLAFVARAKDSDYGLYGAFYEFEWSPVLDAVRAAHLRGAEVRVVYHAVGKGGTTEDNLAAIEEARILSLCTPRTTGKLMHNKFFVLTHRDRPIAVWTGSTNLTMNGIYGHLNCGHVVEDREVAERYLAYWNELRTSPDSAEEKAWMAAENPAPPEPWTAQTTPIFSPRSGERLLDWLAEVAAMAKDPGDALFMTFAFGMDQRFKEVYRRDDEALRFALMDKPGSGRGLEQGKKDIAEIRRRRNVVVAIGNRIVTNSFDRWLAEHGGLTFNVKWVHSKFMLVNPLSRAPVVVTGSGNFSGESVDTNNENMLVIRGNTRVADIYLGEFMRLYTHYAFREAVAIAQASGDTEWRPQHLESDWRSWQRDYFDPGDDRFLRRRYFAQTG
jgi:phosphatidylserine/phosphatidylglycerophosphate/cardiolipin synthase-like enzyme